MEHLLEVCVDSLPSALAAVRGGADRLELCANLLIGGTTPSGWLIEQVVRQAGVPVHVLLRPRAGDFCYDEAEQAELCWAAGMAASAGAKGIVIGCLQPDGALDTAAMRRIAQQAAGLSLTLHRAFDLTADPFAALRAAEELRVNTILTSGQQSNAAQGAPLLAKLVAQSGKLAIMAGSGVTAQNIPQLAAAGVRVFHLSGKKTVPGRMQYRREGVSMGLPFAGEYEQFVTSEQTVRAAKQVLVAL